MMSFSQRVLYLDSFNHTKWPKVGLCARNLCQTYSITSAIYVYNKIKLTNYDKTICRKCLSNPGLVNCAARGLANKKANMKGSRPWANFHQQVHQ